MSADDLSYVCRLCGWQFTTIDGLWLHIPSHPMTPAQYGTLAEIDALTRRLAELEQALSDLRRHRRTMHARAAMRVADVHRLIELVDAALAALPTPSSEGEGVG